MQGLARCGMVMKGGGLLSLTGKLCLEAKPTLFSKDIALKKVICFT